MSEMVNQAAEADLDRSEERSEQGVDGMLEERDPSAMTLSVFGQLLEPEGIVTGAGLCRVWPAHL